MQQPFQERSWYPNSQSRNVPGSQGQVYPTAGPQKLFCPNYGYQSHDQHSATSDDTGMQAQSYQTSGYPTSYAGHWSYTMPPINQKYGRNGGKNGHTVQYCWSETQPERNQQLPFEQQKTRFATVTTTPISNCCHAFLFFKSFFPLTYKSLSLKILVDSGAFSSALTPAMLEKINLSDRRVLNTLK